MIFNSISLQLATLLRIQISFELMSTPSQGCYCLLLLNNFLDFSMPGPTYPISLAKYVDWDRPKPCFELFQTQYDHWTRPIMGIGLGTIHTLIHFTFYVMILAGLTMVLGLAQFDFWACTISLLGQVQYIF